MTIDFSPVPTVESIPQPLVTALQSIPEDSRMEVLLWLDGTPKAIYALLDLLAEGMN
jgi:hypothetical protein